MRLTKFALDNNVVTLVFLAVMTLFGVMTFNSLPRDDMPPYLIRAVNIITSFPGASPQRIEELITDKIEKKVQEVPEIDYITSESRSGISIVTVMIKENEFDLQPIFDKIRRKVDSVQRELPQGAGTPQVDDEVGDIFGILLGLTGDGYTFAELKEIADDFRDSLIKLPDAAKVEIYGGQEERVYIDFENTKFAEYELTKQKLDNILSTKNILFPGGEVVVGHERITLEPTGNLETVDQLKDLIVSSRTTGEVVNLGDIARIYKGYIDPQESIVSVNGVPGLVLAVNLKQGGNLIDLGKQVDREVNYFRQNYPIGVEIERVASQDLVVDESVQNFISNLLQSVVIVLGTMLVFLGLRTGMIVASLIPMAIVFTLVLMGTLGVGLNQVSLAALIIALGMLVDNAIVMSESIMVKMENGAKAVDAALEASGELVIPLLTSSLTTSAAFLAFYLAESSMGEIMGPLFVVVTLALFSSWVLSLSMITLFCVYFLKVKKTDENSGIFVTINRHYRKVLLKVLQKSKTFVASIVLLFVFSMYCMKYLPFMFFPDSERAIVSVNLELPLGTVIEKTGAVVKEIEAYIRTDLKKHVQSWSAYAGAGAPRYDSGYSPPESNSYTAHILINTYSDADNQAVIDALDPFIFGHYPDITSTISRLSSGGASADPVAVRISGKDIEKLYAMAGAVKDKLRAIEGTKNVKDNWGMRTKKIIVDVSPLKSQLADISNQDIAISLQTIFDGVEVGSYREGDKSIPIILREAQGRNIDIENLDSLNIYSQKTGKNIPLKQVADVRVEWEASKILRRDLYKTVTVTSDTKAGYTAQNITDQLIPWLAEVSRNWGHGYSYTLGGESEDSSKAMGAVAEKLPLSFFIIIILLIGQFNSIRKPAIIILTIPLGLIGVIWGLLLARSYFGFMAFLGIISLAGVVINNAIILLDRIKIENEDLKKPIHVAIIDAAQQRLRPILLTTATTAFGLIPLWIGGGLMWKPMAIALIFGLLFGTVLTLLFVPALYKIFFNVKIDSPLK